MISMSKDSNCLKCYLDKNLFKICYLKLHYSKYNPFIKLGRPAEVTNFFTYS